MHQSDTNNLLHKILNELQALMAHNMAEQENCKITDLQLNHQIDHNGTSKIWFTRKDSKNDV
jgi:hypothetical protein